LRFELIAPDRAVILSKRGSDAAETLRITQILDRATAEILRK
jgi:hypothetical protein